jgi:hypothetical protein
MDPPEREQWTEALKCIRCRSVGVARLSADDETGVRADETPEGFLFLHGNFQCSACGFPAKL